MNTLKDIWKAPLVRSGLIPNSPIKSRTLGLFLFAIIVSSFFAGNSIAQESYLDGSCAGQRHIDESNWFDFDAEIEGEIAWILEDRVTGYESETSSQAKKNFSFGEPIYVVGNGNQRYKVRGLGRRDDYSWVDRDNLMCARRPISVGQTNVERKIFIRTETRVRTDEGNTVTAFKSAKLTGCAESDCRKLSRFELYFVMSETEDAYLIGEDLIWSDPTQKLVGWVSKEEAIEWNWTVGLRPRMDLSFNGGPGRICAYVSKDDARAQKDCQPILGGKEWFRLNFRVPILREHLEDGLWEVAVPSAGVYPLKASNGEIRLDPKLFGDVNTNGVNTFKNVDVFFLIDGTRSMQPYIDSVVGSTNNPGVVELVQAALSEKFALGTSLRYGFRVFRDTVPGKMESFGEGLPLRGEECGVLSPEAQKNNRDKFLQGIRTVRTTFETDDDYPEDLLGGIEQAARDISGCPEHLKLLFVLGDAGYDASSQKSKTGYSFSHSDVTARMNSLENTLAFFIRTPSDPALIARPNYLSSWNLFKADALNVLSSLEILDKIQASPHQFFMDISELGSSGYEQLLERVVKHVDDFAQPEVLDEIAVDLRGGASLFDVVSRLRDERTDVPGFFWKLVERGACDDLGEQCKQRVYQGVQTLFIPFSNDVVLELWIGNSELRLWRFFIDSALDSQKNTTERRTAVSSAMSKALDDILGSPAYDGIMPIAEWLEKYRGLPSRFNSPLLAYSVSEIESSDTVPRCELTRIFNWLAGVKNILDTVAIEGKLIKYDELDQGAFRDSCLNLSKKGGDIPLIDPQSVEPVDIGPTAEYSLKKSSAGRRIFWLPQSYLP